MSLPKSELTDKIKHLMSSGRIIPGAITASVLKNEMMRSLEKNPSERFLVDGFPRNMDNVQAWSDAVGDDSRFGIKGVFNFHVSNEEMVHRLKGRGRSDDQDQIIQTRIQSFHLETNPVLEHYRKLGLLIQVNGEDSPEQVYQRCVSTGLF
jgi:adenylate kinase family enzyme